MLLKVLYILIIFQLIIQQTTGLASVYYILGGVMVFKELLEFNFTKKVGKKYLPFLILFVYSFFLLIINLIIEFNFDKIIMFISLFWIPVLFFLKANNGVLKLSSLLKLHVFIAIIGAIAGLIEFHFSRDIFGLVPKLGNLELYENFELFYRTRSIFFSSQINSLFMALSFILLLEFNIINNKLIKVLILLLFTYALILTGSRTAVFIPILYIVFKYPLKSSIVLFPLFLLFFIYFQSNFSSNISDLISRQFDFILDFNKFVAGSNSDRLSRQFEVFADSNIILGNGIGSTYSGSDSYINAESYYVQIFSELGLIGLIFLVLSFISLYFYSKPKLKIIIVVMFLSGFVVHGLSSPYLLMFYLILFTNEHSFKFGDSQKRRGTKRWIEYGKMPNFR